MIERLSRQLGRIRARLLIVNLVVVLVPIVGIEFARLYERQLLSALERDMRDQAVIVRHTVEHALSKQPVLVDEPYASILERSASETRTRIRLLDHRGGVVADSHRFGAPEGSESGTWDLLSGSRESILPRKYERWPEVPNRIEVRAALAGRRGAYTRVRERLPAVFLFIAEPIWHDHRVAGVVYITRSTEPVLAELHRIRRGLTNVLIGTLIFTLCVTLLLAWSISRPLARLARSAKRIAAGERNVKVPVAGGGEIRELAQAFATMTEKLDARLQYATDLAADVAHEFKSPLTSIRGAAELLEDAGANDPEAQRRFLANIQSDVARLDRLVSRLLQLSRIEASTEPHTELDLAALLRDVANRAETPQRPIRIHYETLERKMHARKLDLETAMLNVLENAVRFSPDEAAVDVHVRDARNGLTITVRDQGPGIPESHLPRIFDRFFTTDAERRGTGLGLAIAKSVIHAHGGEITANTAIDGGAVVEIFLRSR